MLELTMKGTIDLIRATRHTEPRRYKLDAHTARRLQSAVQALVEDSFGGGAKYKHFAPVEEKAALKQLLNHKSILVEIRGKENAKCVRALWMYDPYYIVMITDDTVIKRVALEMDTMLRTCAKSSVGGNHQGRGKGTKKTDEEVKAEIAAQLRGE